MTTNQNFISDLKSQIIDKLNGYAGGNYYACDLAQILFEGENVNGSVFCNTYKTKEFIKENFALFGELVEHWENVCGETLNPFLEPEKAHVILLLEAAQSVLSCCELIDLNWNNQIELTEDFINELTSQINEFDSELF